MHVVSHVECDNQVKGQYINVCVNGDIQPPAEPMDAESVSDDELDNLMIDDPSPYGPTYH
jgi:hypothetical protein